MKDLYITVKFNGFPLKVNQLEKLVNFLISFKHDSWIDGWMIEVLFIYFLDICLMICEICFVKDDKVYVNRLITVKNCGVKYAYFLSNKRKTLKRVRIS